MKATLLPQPEPLSNIHKQRLYVETEFANAHKLELEPNLDMYLSRFE